MSRTVKRLYPAFKPANYQLHLSPDRDTMQFTGSVTITGHKTRPSQRLTFHQNGLKITAATIRKIDKKQSGEYAVARVNHHAGMEEVRLHADQLLYPGTYAVTLEFEGRITRPMEGIYPCFFTENGIEKQLIATQFESHYARMAFPCIDEPEAKATFDLSIESHAGEAVVANTPVKDITKTKEGRTTTSFETTPVMSTYLLAFVTGELAYQEAKTKAGVTVRTYATPENVGFTDFALDVAVKTLDFYNEYFEIPYPLPKCDMIALPDFASGAMENWGCVTYRESCMLVDPDNTSLHTKQYVAMVVAHELAHQWFGNLVTMQWWTDLWLNEGFASWVEYLAVDKLFPDWHMWTQFVADEQQAALRLDALDNTHPVEVPVPHPDEIRSIFDAISYNKGASVIHMLNNYLGGEVFRKGLVHYLKKHAYSNAATLDLWRALEEVSGKPVRNFMHAWTAQPGFPVVHAHLEDDKLKLKQERFYLQRPDEEAVPLLWPVPLSLNIAHEAAVFDKAVDDLPAAKADLIKLNTGQSGFYRVAYDTELTTRLATAVAANKLEALDRLGLLSDSFEAAKAGFGDTESALALLASYRHETNAATWSAIVGAIADVRRVMGDEELREAMKPFIRKLSARELARLGWEEQADEDHFDTLLRPTIIGLNAGADEPDVVTEALTRFKTATKPEDIHPNLRSLVYDTAVRKGGQPEFDKLVKWYKQTDSAEERTTLAAAIAFFRQPEIIAQALALIDTPLVKLQDVGYWVAYSFMNYHGKAITWKWLQAHWGWLKANLENDLSFTRFPVYAARPFSDKAFLKEYEAFFGSVRTPGIERAIRQGVETITWQAAWRERDYKAVSNFFAKHQ